MLSLRGNQFDTVMFVRRANNIIVSVTVLGVAGIGDTLCTSGGGCGGVVVVNFLL